MGVFTNHPFFSFSTKKKKTLHTYDEIQDNLSQNKKLHSLIESKLSIPNKINFFNAIYF